MSGAIRRARAESTGAGGENIMRMHRIGRRSLRPFQQQPLRRLHSPNPNDTSPMKTILALVTAALTLGVAAPATAEARPGPDFGSGMGHSHGRGGSTRVAYHCRNCGAPVYQVRYIAFYHRDGCPVYRWRTVSHHCRWHGHRGHDHGRGHSSHGHGH